jgi:hypothetical protein
MCCCQAGYRDAVSRRIDIELTSQRSESEWTWRAAGAKLPKGSLDAKLLYSGAKVGDVTRAEADFAIEGIEILEVFPPQGKRQEKAKVIEIKGPEREFQGVTSQLAPKGKGGPRRDRGDRNDRGGDRGGRPGGSGGRPGGRGAPSGPPGGGRPSDRIGGGKLRPQAGGSGEQRGARDNKGRGDRPQRRDRPERPAAPTFKKLTPGDAHRQAVLTDIAPEHRPIAEQVLRGGIPAVRQAIEAENTKAKAEGRPEINAPAFIAIAEELLPKLKAADWMDRAEAAKKQVDEISVRDLRSVVTGADAVARTDEARLLASELREALDRRTQQERENWVKEMTTALDEGRVVRALRLSARPPDAQSKFPQELLDRLKEGAQEAMTPETQPDRWVTMIEAVSASPVRRNVEPKGLPAEPGEALLNAAKQASGRIPALAKMLGVSIPPPPTKKAVPPKPAAAAPAAAPETAPAAEPTEPSETPAEEATAE